MQTKRSPDCERPKERNHLSPFSALPTAWRHLPNTIRASKLSRPSNPNGNAFHACVQLTSTELDPGGSRLAPTNPAEHKPIVDHACLEGAHGHQGHETSRISHGALRSSVWSFWMKGLHMKFRLLGKPAISLANRASKSHFTALITIISRRCFDVCFASFYVVLTGSKGTNRAGSDTRS